MGSIETSTFSISTPIPPPTTIVSLHTGKLKPLGSLSITSGIVKFPRTGPVHCSFLGLTEDEHDPTFHGGVDKALHQYCSSHYPLWQSMYPAPEIAANFVPGGFGENLIASGFSETNICIGDKVRIGPPNSDDLEGDDVVIVEVSLPRQPCFKLNQRFGIKNLAGKTHQLNRTGWYYRVLKEGWIEAGMEMRVLERRNPQWSIERVHHFIHRETENRAVMEDAVTVKEMGAEAKKVFVKRLKKMEEEGMVGERRKPTEVWRPFKVVEKEKVTERVVGILLEAVEETEEVVDTPLGSYVRLELPNGLRRAYSIVGGKTNRFQLGIARDDNSRGGSIYVHNTLQVGSTVLVGNISGSVPKVSDASNHIYLVGGIGITAFLALMAAQHSIHLNFELHYAVRSASEIAFESELGKLGSNVTVYNKAEGQRMNVSEILKTRKWNSHIYVCGPRRLMDEVVRCAEVQEIADDEIHYEAFQTPTTGDPFTVEVEGRDMRLEVGEEQTLLEVLRKAGIEVESSCEAGNCGTCRVGVKRGMVEHRGTGLGKEERESGTAMLSCVSRGVGCVVIEVPEV